jgi:alkanesulfonate monooxygenase SsuD/methylene tetrahydromethanopterin reductase-like flavin-dependent oxidoreductase (luciferase family)
MVDQPFRFGIVATPEQRPGATPAATAAAWQQLARSVENAGYSSLLVPDTMQTLSSLPSCAVAAGATSSLRVGPYVLSVPNRRPELIAHDSAALHVLTGRRFELGLGAGRPGAEADAAALGMPFGSPVERIRQLEAAAAAVRSANPEIPIMIAGSGPKLLTLAGHIADIVAFGLSAEAGIDELRQAVDRVNGSGRDIELSINLLCVGDDPPPYLRRWLNLDLPDLIARKSISVLTGSVAEMVDTLGTLRETCGVSYICAGSAFLERLTPVVAQLAGN